MDVWKRGSGSGADGKAYSSGHGYEHYKEECSS